MYKNLKWRQVIFLNLTNVINMENLVSQNLENLFDKYAIFFIL